jgi:phage terminase small subunit
MPKKKKEPLQSAMVKLTIIQDLHTLAHELKRTPTSKDIVSCRQGGGQLSLTAIRSTFGSLPGALRAAKLPLTKKQEFTRQQLIDQLRDLSHALGRPLLRADITRAWQAETCARPATFERVFTTVGNAIRQAGAGRTKALTRADLVSQYKALSKQLGRPATDADIRRAARENKCAGIGYFQKVGGGLEKIRLDLGLSTKYSRGTLIKQLTALAGKLGRTPIAKEVEAASRRGETAALGTYQAFFGGYKAALQAAGLLPKRGYSRIHLLQFLRQLARELGHQPTTRELERVSARGDGPGIQPYKNRFGGLAAAISAAGLDDVPRRPVPSVKRNPRPRTDLLEQLQRLAGKLGRVPTPRDVDEAHSRGECASKSLFGAEFGGVINALQAAGFSAVGRRQTRERLIEALHQMARELGKIPSSRDITKAKGKYPAVRTFERYFGSFPAARDAAGLNRPNRRNGRERQ